MPPENRVAKLTTGLWTRLWLMLLCLSAWPIHAAAAAVPPAPLVEYKHDAWSIERGAPSRINSIAQTRDGYLWIGSVEGLFRFDGMSFEAVRPQPPGAPRLVVSSLLASRSGDLWVGLARGGGVMQFRGGQLTDTRMPNPSREVNAIKEDAEGGIWVARGGRSDHTLARFHQGTWHELDPESGLPAQPVWGLHFSRDGTMWVVLSNTLAYRKPGEPRFSISTMTITPRASLTEDGQGRMWVSDAKGTRALDAPAGPDTSFAHPSRIGGTRVLFDRQGDLWMTTWNGGVLRIRAPGRPLRHAETDAPRVASFDAAAGLTSDQTRALLQDREGNIWIGTELGLDQLRPAQLIVESGLPRNSPTSYRMAAARDGTVYVADAQALYAIAPGQQPRRLLPHGTAAEALCAAGDGGVWLFLADRVLRVGAGAVRSLPKPAQTTAYGCAEDNVGRLWMPGLEQGLHWMQGGAWQRWPEPMPSRSLPANVMQDRAGRAVVLFRARPPQGELPFLALDASHSRAGGIEGMLPGEAGALVSGAEGMALAFDPSGVVLSSAANPWSASINGLTQTPDGDTWAIGDVGIVHLRSADLNRALQQPGAALKPRIFDFHDGLNSFVQKAPGAQVAVGGDGRVWFLTRSQVMRLDPAAIKPNALPPPVLVRSVQAGDQTFAAAPQIALPAGTTTLRIAFTALSLSVPERVQFRHRLLGVDDRWSAPSNQRNVLLSDLGPGRYQFQVRASNNDGLWSDQPVEMTLTIPATFRQSLAFKLGLAALTLLLLYALYLARLRQILRGIRDRGEERLRERERIARDMHDTLLQSVQGLILRFQAIADRLQGDPQLQQLMIQTLDRAETVVVEGRDRLQGLRRVDTSDLEQEVRRLIAELPFADRTQVSVVSQGLRRSLRPNVFDELLCIVSEALFNAARHADSSEVTVQIDYGRRWLAVEVRDNGIGLPAEKAAMAGQQAHFGLLGMRERAQRIGAQFRLDGHSGQGTQVSLRIKASIAYAHDRE